MKKNNEEVPPILDEQHHNPIVLVDSKVGTGNISRNSKDDSTGNSDPKASKDDLKYVVKTLFAGGIAGCIAKTAVAPFDRVKILFQTGNPHYRHKAGTITGVFHVAYDIYHKDGLLALYRGHSAMLLRIFPYAAIQFMSYEQFKLLLDVEGHRGVVWRSFLAGSLAGMCSVALTYPLDTLRARMAAQVRHHEHESIIHLIRRMAREGPYAFSSFYKGFMPTMYGIIPYAGVSFYSYETLKRYVIKFKTDLNRSNSTNNTDNNITSMERLVCGTLAGAIAQTVAYPLDVVRRRMQLSHSKSHIPPLSSTLHAFRHLIHSEGLKGMVLGLSVNYVKVAPATGISFLAYETMKGWMSI